MKSAWKTSADVADDVVKYREGTLSSYPNTVSHIDGVEASKHVEDLMSSATMHHNLDAGYNTMFHSMAMENNGAPRGYWAGAGLFKSVNPHTL